MMIKHEYRAKQAARLRKYFKAYLWRRDLGKSMGASSGSGDPCGAWEILLDIVRADIIDICEDLLTCRAFGGNCTALENLLSDARQLVQGILADAKEDGCDLEWTDPCPEVQ